MKIQVFVPLGSCVCDFAPFMEKVGRATAKFKDLVEIETKSIKSKEASKYRIQDMCIVIEGEVKFSVDFDEKELETAILEKLSHKNA